MSDEDRYTEAGHLKSDYTPEELAEMESAKSLWIVRYSHRHGDDCWPVFEAPTREQVIAELDNWEGEGSEAEREDEHLEFYGPFELPRS